MPLPPADDSSIVTAQNLADARKDVLNAAKCNMNKTFGTPEEGIIDLFTEISEICDKINNGHYRYHGIAKTESA